MDVCVARAGGLLGLVVRTPLALALALVLALTFSHAAVAEAAGVDLSHRCQEGNCDEAFAALEAGGTYYLPAGVWRFTKPLILPSDVTLTGDGTGIYGTDLVYSGEPTDGAVVIAGAAGEDWVDGHLAAVEIETEQLHEWRLAGDTTMAMEPISQAAVGLEIDNPTASSSIDNVNVWKFGRTSVLVRNHATAPGPGAFQFSDFFIGTSPHPFEVQGSSVTMLVRFGGIDLGPLSRAGMVFSGDPAGAVSVVESVKVEGDYDVPGFVVAGTTPVVFVGSTRYLNQSLYVSRPLNGAPAFLSRDSAGAGTSTIQCFACTALGEQTALAITDQSVIVPTSKWGIDLHEMTPANARRAAQILETPATPVTRPHDVVDLGARCPGHDCDRPLADLRFGGRYYLPHGVWTFSRPFTLPPGVTFFGDGRRAGNHGGTELRYVGSSLPGGAAVRFGPGGADMGAARLFSLRISTRAPLRSGFGLRARDATNASTIADISIAGFPDGQLLADTTPPNAGSGPNFFRITQFDLDGGVHPLKVEGGRQTLMIEQGGIRLGATSLDGLFLTGGEQLAATLVVESVSVKGRRDVPGFRVFGPAVTAFVHSARRGSSMPSRAAGFAYGARVPRRATECLGCVVGGGSTAFRMSGLDVAVPASKGRAFDFLNGNAALERTASPVNVDLPVATGSVSVGGTLTPVNGAWTNQPSAYAYEWVRCKRADMPSDPATRCVRIPGATVDRYEVTTADRGFYLRVAVTATSGSSTGTATSPAVVVTG
jgi:hypothetical protein